MPEDLRDLITRTLLAHGTVTCAARADAILAALDAAGWTIVKRNTALTAAGDNPHDAPLARAALRVQAVALAAFQQTPATPNPGSIPAGEADTPTEGETGSQQQCRVCLSYGICYMPKRCPKEVR